MPRGSFTGGYFGSSKFQYGSPNFHTGPHDGPIWPDVKGKFDPLLGQFSPKKRGQINPFLSVLNWPFTGANLDSPDSAPVVIYIYIFFLVGEREPVLNLLYIVLCLHI